MADPLKLLFELDAEGEPAVKEFRRVSAAFATELNSLKQMAATAVKSTLAENRPAASGPSDGAAASRSTLDAQREVNRQLDSMWTAREKEQAASLKKQADVDKGFAAQQVSTAQQAAKEIAEAYKDRESQLAKTAKQSEDAWAKHEQTKLSATKQAEKESEAAVAASNAAKDKAAKLASDNFLRLQKQTTAVVAKANAQTAANEIRAALVAAKGTADVSSVASKSIESLGDHLNLLIGHRIPLAGGAFIRLTENVRGFVTLSREAEGSVLRLGSIIADLSSKTGKSAPEIKDFLNSFARLGSQVEKDEAAVAAFGPALAQKLIPQLAAADAEMSALAASTGETGGAFAALAGPIGIAVLAVAAIVTTLGLAEKKMFDVAVASAKFEGKFVDLSQQVGLSTELLSAFDVLASTTGSDMGSLSASFGIFQKHLEDAQDPMSQSAGLLGELGIQTTDTESALRQTFSTLAKMPEGFRQTALALQLFGRGGKSVLAIIKETNGDLDAAIKRFRDLGLIVSLEDAKAADKFNDEMELLNRQFEDLTVELGKQFLPAALEIVRALSDLTKASKGLFDLLGTIGKPAIDTFADSLRGLSLIVASLNHDLPTVARILKEIQDRDNIAPIEVPGIQPVPLPGPKSALEKAREESRLVKAEVSSAVQFAESQIAEIDRQLQLREVSPATALEPIIALERQKTEAVIKGLEAQREARGKEFIKDEADRQKMADDIQAIDQQIASKQAEFDKFEADKRAAFRAQELQREQDHRRALADLFVNALNDRIAAINRTAQAGTNSELFAQDVTTKLLEAGFAKRKEVLERERVEAGKDPALVQQINSRLADLQRERTATLAEQTDRRLAIVRDEQRKQLDLQRQTIDSFLRASEITDSSRIATIKALADLRVKTEEQAAREIVKIRLDALDRERGVALAERELIDQQIQSRLDAFANARRSLLQQEEKLRADIRAELEKTGTIKDAPGKNARLEELRNKIKQSADTELDAQKKANKDRANADTDLNNKLRVLGAERSQIQADGNRDIETGRQDDLTNLRQYAQDIENIQREIADITRETQRIIIDIMIGRNARRADIIRAQRDLELKEEADRHKRVTDSISAQRLEVDEQIRVLESHLKSLKIGTTEEIEEHERLIAELEKLRLKRAELKAQQDAEDERSRTRKRRVTDASDKDLKEADPLGRLGLDVSGVKDLASELVGAFASPLETLRGLFAKTQEAMREFVSETEKTIVPLGDILQGTFLQIADAIGQTVENWVLLGTTGPAVMRKILAQALANLAKEATINAIKELALGFATLFFNPAESAAHFTAAALWGSIAGASALLGRHAAGDLFKQKDTASRAVGGGEPQPNNRNFDSSGSGVTEPSSQAVRNGSGGFLGRVIDRIEAIQQQNLDVQRQQQLHNAQVAQALSKLGTARPGDVVTIGAPDAAQAIGVAVIGHSNSSGDFNEALQRNLGFA